MNLLLIIALFLFWLILSGSLAPAHLFVGALTAFVVVWISPRGVNKNTSFSLLGALGYGFWLFFRVMKSGFHVSKLILHPKLPVTSQLLEHDTPLRGSGELTVLGNSITLTPGTITIEIEPGKLVVHALDKASLDDVSSGEMDRRVANLFNKSGGRSPSSSNEEGAV